MRPIRSVGGCACLGSPNRTQGLKGCDLRPSAPSFISRVCPFHSPRFEAWRARRERSPRQARATGALRASAHPAMSEAGDGCSRVASDQANRARTKMRGTPYSRVSSVSRKTTSSLISLSESGSTISSDFNDTARRARSSRRWRTDLSDPT